MKLITEMFEGVEGIDESIINKAQTLVEAEINEQVGLKVTEAVQAEVSRLDEQYETAKQNFITESEEKLSAFIDSVVVEWAKENAVAIDNQIKVQIAEQFVTTLKEAFVAAEVQLPANEESTITSLQEQITAVEADKAKLQTQLNEATAELVTKNRIEILTEATKGLVDTQADRVKRLTEGFEFKDADSFKEKVSIIVEAITDKKPEKEEKEEDSDKDADTDEIDDEGKPIEKKDKKEKIDESTAMREQALRLITGKK